MSWKESPIVGQRLGLGIFEKSPPLSAEKVGFRRQVRELIRSSDVEEPLALTDELKPAKE